MAQNEKPIICLPDTIFQSITLESTTPTSLKGICPRFHETESSGHHSSWQTSHSPSFSSIIHCFLSCPKTNTDQYPPGSRHRTDYQTRNNTSIRTSPSSAMCIPLYPISSFPPIGETSGWWEGENTYAAPLEGTENLAFYVSAKFANTGFDIGWFDAGLRHCSSVIPTYVRTNHADLRIHFSTVRDMIRKLVRDDKSSLNSRVCLCVRVCRHICSVRCTTNVWIVWFPVFLSIPAEFPPTGCLSLFVGTRYSSSVPIYKHVKISFRWRWMVVDSAT